MPAFKSAPDCCEHGFWSQPLTGDVKDHLAGLALADQAFLLVGFEQKDAAKIVTRVGAEINLELRDRVEH